MKLKKKIYHRKSSVLLRDVDIKKLLVSNKIFFGGKNYKFFIRYLHNDHKVSPLHIMFPKTSAYVKSYDGQNKWIYGLHEENLRSDWVRGVQYWLYLSSVFNICTL